jgi:hypothetical protein
MRRLFGTVHGTRVLSFVAFFSFVNEPLRRENLNAVMRVPKSVQRLAKSSAKSPFSKYCPADTPKWRHALPAQVMLNAKLHARKSSYSCAFAIPIQYDQQRRSNSFSGGSATIFVPTRAVMYARLLVKLARKQLRPRTSG